MDAVIQVEASEVRAVVTNTSIIIFSGRLDDNMVSAWTTVSLNVFELLEHSILTNAPNSSLILV